MGELTGRYASALDRHLADLWCNLATGGVNNKERQHA
jgi:hypothetical protein